MEENHCLSSLPLMCVTFSAFWLRLWYHVLYWLRNIYEGAELPSLYFIIVTKHSRTYLALTKLIPVLLTHLFQILNYTHCVAIWCILFQSLFRWHSIKVTLHPQAFFHGCQIVHWDPLNAKRRCPKKMVSAMWNCMVSMATHSEFEKGVSLQNYSYLSCYLS